MSDLDLDAREFEAYARAAERLEYVLEQWVSAGRPLVTVHGNGMTGPSALWRVVREAETDYAKRLAKLRPTHRGPRATAVISADIGLSPAQRLRLLE